MADMKKAPKPGQIQLKGHWGDMASLDQVFVDEMLLQAINERCYITFGQVQMPGFASPADAAGASVEIRPMVKLVLTKESLLRMLGVLNKQFGEQKESK